MAATAIMATLMASVVVVMRSGYAAWNAQEADIDVLENGYGVLRHFVAANAAGDSVTAITAPANTTGSLSFTTSTGATRTWSCNAASSEVYFNNGTSNNSWRRPSIDEIYRLQGRRRDRDHHRRRHPSREVHGANHAAARRRRHANAVLPGLDSIVVTTNDQSSTQRVNKQPQCGDAGVSRQRASRCLSALFVLSIVTVWAVDMLESATVYQSALRNTIEYEQALYQANAGVHHAVAELETDTSWRGTVTAGSYPASGSYSATAVNGARGGHRRHHIHRRGRRHHAPPVGHRAGELKGFETCQQLPTSQAIDDQQSRTRRRLRRKRVDDGKSDGAAIAHHRSVPLDAAPGTVSVALNWRVTKARRPTRSSRARCAGARRPPRCTPSRASRS